MRTLLLAAILTLASSSHGAYYGKPAIPATPYFTVATSTQVIFGSTTLVDIGGLSATLAAGGTYYFEVFVVFQTTATADGFRLDFAASAGLALVCYSREIMIVAGNSTDSYSSRYMTSFGGDTASASVNAANADHLARADGIVTVGASNYTFQVRGCGELATSKATIKGGRSWLRITPLQ